MFPKYYIKFFYYNNYYVYNLQQANTFQLILITDSASQSYAIFIYNCNDITWSGVGSNHARVGITDGDGSTWTHSDSGNSTIVNIDCSVPSNSYVNIILDLRDFGVARAPQMNSSTPAPNVMAQTTGVTAQAGVSSTQGKPYLLSYSHTQTMILSVNINSKSSSK